MVGFIMCKVKKYKHLRGISLEKSQKTELGEHLAWLIKVKRMTQQKFYQKVGITKPYFYDILSGKTNPSPEVQFKMLEILKPSKRDTIKFLDLVAKAREELPADIVSYLLGNEKKYRIIRQMMENDI